MKQKKSYDKSVGQALVLITQFGLNMLVPIGMLSALGCFLDQRLDTSYWTALLFFIGAIAGGQNVYRMAKKVYQPPAERKGKKEPQPEDENHGNIEKNK